MDKNAQRFRKGQLLTARDNSMICVLPFFAIKYAPPKVCPTFGVHIICPELGITDYRMKSSVFKRVGGGGDSSSAADKYRRGLAVYFHYGRFT